MNGFLSCPPHARDMHSSQLYTTEPPLESLSSDESESSGVSYARSTIRQEFCHCLIRSPHPTAPQIETISLNAIAGGASSMIQRHDHFHSTSNHTHHIKSAPSPCNTVLWAEPAGFHGAQNVNALDQVEIYGAQLSNGFYGQDDRIPPEALSGPHHRPIASSTQPTRISYSYTQHPCATFNAAGIPNPHLIHSIARSAASSPFGYPPLITQQLSDPFNPPSAHSPHRVYNPNYQLNLPATFPSNGSNIPFPRSEIPSPQHPPISPSYDISSFVSTPKNISTTYGVPWSAGSSTTNDFVGESSDDASPGNRMLFGTGTTGYTEQASQRKRVTEKRIRGGDIGSPSNYMLAIGDHNHSTLGGNGADSSPSTKKVKMACHFCRRRKLRCSGDQPKCNVCENRQEDCQYDEQVRRRGAGKKNRIVIDKAKEEVAARLEVDSPILVLGGREESMIPVQVPEDNYKAGESGRPIGNTSGIPGFWNDNQGDSFISPSSIGGNEVITLTTTIG